jgi:hypothetical protein
MVEVEGVVEYGNFVHEAFIKPIRSVLIIDDDYPTLDEVLTEKKLSGKKKWHTEPEPILNVINSFRADPALIVDVHDGTNLTDKNNVILAAHLHQSDLLVLDYDLNKDGGAKATSVAKHVLDNDHFNLVIVHTEEKIEKPFESMLLSLLTEIELDSGLVKKGEQWIQELEDRGVSVIEADVLKTIQFQQYATLRKVGCVVATKMVWNGDAVFADFKSILDRHDVKGRTVKDVFYWALSKFQLDNKSRFIGSRSDPDWSEAGSRYLWIRTDRGFLSFTNKANSSNLLEVLHSSLMEWGPSPSRLLSAKLRAVYESKGGIIESASLKDADVQAKFYETLFDQTPAAERLISSEERMSIIDSQVDRQVESMTSGIRKHITNYFLRLYEVDIARRLDTNFGREFGVDVTSSTRSEKATIKFNSYVSLLPDVTSWHLMPGHIFEFQGNRWVCLSPVCDLVPFQREKGIYADVGQSNLPFMAVKLHRATGTLDGINIGSNSFIFLENEARNGEFEPYCFFGEPKLLTGVHWTMFVARNNGKLDADKNVNISRVSNSQGDESLSFESQDCKMVAQLRYEYALNLMHKLGSQLTRVGLDFVN